MILKKELLLTREEKQHIDLLLNSTDVMNENDTESWTIPFGNNIEMDIKICGANNDHPWTEAVLFDNGSEVSCSEPCDFIEGEWELDYDNNTYFLSVKLGSEDVCNTINNSKGGGAMERLTKKGFNFTTDFIKRDIDSWSISQCLKKLQEYEDLEEQGLLLRLPCKVGDTVYYISNEFIEPCTVEVIFLADYTDKDGNSSYMAEIHYDREDCPYVSTEIYFTDLGKTVFLSKAEAEQKLKEMESD